MSANHKKSKTMLCFVGLILLLSAFGFLSSAKTARAQGLTVPISTQIDYHNIMSNLKDFVLDRLATLMAKQILHQMTASVVNWINTGFRGSPSFLTNPAGFFLNSANQISGVFLSNGGPLSSLCSPFNTDIRLALALGAAQDFGSSLGLTNLGFNLGGGASGLSNSKYSCTLGSIIANGGKGSMSGFLNGDFSQGGWPAFISLTTDPQNDPYSAYLIADGDLHAQIAAKQASINADLSRGQGFMSWQNCTDIPGGTVDSSNPDEVNTAEAMVAGNTSVNRQMNSDGTMTYQTCTTQTPGSVIAGTLQKSLNVPSDELELANNINAVINALVSQMTTQMLSKGLGALSAGGQSSYTSQITQDSTSANSSNAIQARQNAADDVTMNMQGISDSIATYDQAIGIVAASQVPYQNALACFTDKVTSETRPNSPQYTFGQSQIAAIEADLNDSVDPLIATLQTSRQNLENTLQQLASTSDEISGVLSTDSTMSSVDQINAQNGNFDAYISNLENGVKGSTAQNTADQDLTNATTQAKQFTKDAQKYQDTCNAFPEFFGQTY